MGENIPMKIMHFIYGLNTGGAETLVKNYMLNFDRKKNKVVLLCLEHKKDSLYGEILEKNGIRIVYAADHVPSRKKHMIFGKLFNHCYRYMVVRRIIRKENPDILHTHLAVNTFVKFARPDSKMAIFHTVHAEPRKLWLKSGWRQIRDFRAAKWLVKHYNMRFIALHDDMKNEINNMFNVNNTLVFNNGIDLSEYHKKNGNSMRQELNIPERAFVLGHVGRFSEAKNHVFLVEVFKEFVKKEDDAFLLMVGDGPIKNEIAEKLDAYGLKNKYLILSDRSDVPDVLASMNAFVFPSLFESLGIALIEAQEAKIPCFVSNNIPEHAKISNLVKRLSLSYSPEEWANSICSYNMPEKILLNDADWDIKRITKNLEQIYSEALVRGQHG